MRRNLLIVFLLTISFYGRTQSTKSIDSLIDQWHLAAANADFTKYFSITCDKFVFLGVMDIF